MEAGNRQDSVSWAYARPGWPRISAVRLWTRQRTGVARENEESFRLSLNKGLKRLSVALAYLQGARNDKRALRPLWKRNGLIGDAGLQLTKDRRLNLHYECNELSSGPASQLWSKNLHVDSRISFFGEKVAITPAMDYARLRNSQSSIDQSQLNATVSTIFTLPRYVPGADLLVTFNSRHTTARGQPDRTQAGLMMRWNFKRL
jgi:hypothetical protein